MLEIFNTAAFDIKVRRRRKICIFFKFLANNININRPSLTFIYFKNNITNFDTHLSTFLNVMCSVPINIHSVV